MRHDHRWPIEGGEKSREAAFDIFVALSAGRPVGPAGGVPAPGLRRLPLPDLAHGRAFPGAEAEFGEALLGDEEIGIKPCGLPQQPGGIRGARKRADKERALAEIGNGAREQPPDRARLITAAWVEGHVPTALQAAFDVPVRLAVADEDQGDKRRVSAAQPTTEMSGASGFFMPTM